MKNYQNRLLMILVSVVFTTPASAVVLTYITSGIGSGSLGGTSFVDSPFTITATADTMAIVSEDPLIYTIEPIAATVDILGTGTATFTFSTFLVVNQLNNVGQSRVGFSDRDQFLTVFHVVSPELASYDLSTIIDVPGDEGEGRFNPTASFPTTSGQFVLSSVTDSRFQAVPEPSLFLMVTIGIPSLFLRRSRSRTSRG